MSDRVKTAVNDGVVSEAASVKLNNPEAMRLIQQARVKVIPFLDATETGPLEAAVNELEQSQGENSDKALAELRRLLAPYSYLF